MPSLSALPRLWLRHAGGFRGARNLRGARGCWEGLRGSGARRAFLRAFHGGRRARLGDRGLEGSLGNARCGLVEIEIGGPNVETAALRLAHVERARLAIAHEEVGRLAARAGLRHRARAKVLVARGVVRAAIEWAEAPAPHEDFARLALRALYARKCHGLRRLEPANRIIRARDVVAEPAVPRDEGVAAARACLTRRDVGLRLGLSARDFHGNRVATDGIGRAAEERGPVPAGTELHRAAAFFAGLTLEVGRVDRVFLHLGDVLREVAVGIPAACDEEARLPHAELQRMTALRARVPGIARELEVDEALPHLGEGKARLQGDHLLFRLVAILDELAV